MSAKSRMAARAALVAFILILAVGITAAYTYYVYSIYPLNQARGWLSRAQSGSYAIDMIGAMNMADKTLEPKHGNPCWAFPTEYTDWDMIKTDLHRQISRLVGLAQIDPNTAAYAQGLADVRGKLNVMCGQIDNAISWEWRSETNAILMLVFLCTEILLGVTTTNYWDS